MKCFLRYSFLILHLIYFNNDCFSQVDENSKITIKKSDVPDYGSVAVTIPQVGDSSRENQIKNEMIEELKKSFDYWVDPKKIKFRASGIVIGSMLAPLMINLGLMVNLHELVGHLFLGGRLMYLYDPSLPLVSYGKNLQVDAFDNFKKINQMNLIHGLDHLLEGHDSHHDGAYGWSKVGYGAIDLTNVANDFCFDRRSGDVSAWISLSGSIPGLWTRFYLASAGRSLFSQYPFLSALLLSFSFFEELKEQYYPWSVVGEAKENLYYLSQTGHDFANFAVQTGINPRTTARVISSIIPVLNLIYNLLMISPRNNIVTDYQAMIHFAENQLSEDHFTALREENKSIENYLGSNIIQAHKNILLEKFNPNYKNSLSKLTTFRESLEKINFFLLPFWPLINTMKHNNVAKADHAQAIMNLFFPISSLYNASETALIFSQDLKSERHLVPSLAVFLSLLQLSIDSLKSLVMIYMASEFAYQEEIPSMFSMVGGYNLPLLYCLIGMSAICSILRNNTIAKPFASFMSEI